MTHTMQPFSVPFRTPSPVTPSSELALTLLGPSPSMAHLWGNLRRVAPHVRVVLLTGEPDCGQEAVARVLLDLSFHPQRAFVTLTAAGAEAQLLRPNGFVSLPTDLFLFVPEIDTFSIAAQEALFRLLRTRRSRPFTLVASTSEELRSLVALGRFSPELADALCSIRLGLPSLKDRLEDLPMIVNHMLATHTRELGRAMPQPAQDFLRAAMQYKWPGNLRELSNILSLLCSNTESTELRAADLHSAVALAQNARTFDQSPVRLVSLDTVMQEHIAIVLHACHGNKLKASEVLGISRSTLYRMLESASASQKTLPLAS